MPVRGLFDGCLDTGLITEGWASVIDRVARHPAKEGNAARAVSCCSDSNPAPPAHWARWLEGRTSNLFSQAAAATTRARQRKADHLGKA